MPLYQFKNKESGEVIEKVLRISQLDEWKAENPLWESYHTKPPGLTSSSKSTMSMAGKDWEDHLNRIKKGSGDGSTIET